MRWRPIALALAWVGCGHACPTVQARLDVAGPPLDGEALREARSGLRDLRAGVHAWHQVEAQRTPIVEAVARAYRNAGYPDARAGGFTVQLTRDRSTIRVGVRVAAGARRRVAAVRILEIDPAREGPPATPHAAAVRVGEWYAEDAVSEAVAALERLYADNGYARPVIAPRLTPRGAGVVLDLQVDPGPRFTVRAVQLVVSPGREASEIEPSVLGLRAGEPFRISAVEAAADELRERYPGRVVHWRVVPGDPDLTNATLRFLVTH